MSLDVRTRAEGDARALHRDELLDGWLVAAAREHGPLAARGVAYLDLPPLGLDVEGRAVTLVAGPGRLTVREGVDRAGVVAVLDAGALSDLVQDLASTMGLAMSSRASIQAGNLHHWVAWEPALRALFDGRRVHEAGDVVFTDREGRRLDLDRAFHPDDDRDEMARFLEQAGFLHLRSVFTPAEMAALEADLDEWMARAEPDDGESWWATDEHGAQQAVRVLYFHDKSATLRALLGDPKFSWLADLTGNGHRHSGNAEALVKPLGVVRGLSDLPWHKDCGQGRHSYLCNSLTCGVSVTGADRRCGALGVVPGSHRANTMGAGRDPRLDLAPRMLETATGDVTVHCSDTLHRAHPPIDHPRKVVYTSFVLPPLGTADAPPPDPDVSRAARAALNDVQSRIEAADNPASPERYRAGLGR